MKKILFLIISLIIFTFVACTKRVTGDEKTAENYVKSQGYKIASQKGEIQKYTLEKDKLYGTAETIQYQQMWSVQKEDPDEYLGKEITIYGFTVKDHPLQKRDRNAKNGVNVYIMLSEGKVIGGYSYPDADVDGAYSSIDGKTLEEVTGLSYQQWSENWKKKYSIISDSEGKVNSKQQPSNETVIQTGKLLNTRVLVEKEFKISNKLILKLKYEDLIKLWGKPKKIEKMKVYFPATETPYYIYILKYDNIEIEMYPVAINVPVENTESFRFDITGSKYDFYGVKVGMSLDDYLKTLENKDVFLIKEILGDTIGAKVPNEYRKLLIMLKEDDYYANYEKAIYEQVIVNGMPYGVVVLFKNNKISRIVYGYPNAS